MGTKKSTSTTVNQTPQFVEQPKNPYYEKAAKSLDTLDFTTPIIQGFGQQDNLIKESGNDIFGANTSPEMAQKVRDSRLFKSATDKGNALSGAVQQQENAKNSGYMSLGGATAPVMFNPGSTNTQKVSDPWGTAMGIAGLGIQGASAAFAPGANGASA